jgi:hypothetical protein
MSERESKRTTLEASDGDGGNCSRIVRGEMGDSCGDRLTGGLNRSVNGSRMETCGFLELASVVASDVPSSRLLGASVVALIVSSDDLESVEPMDCGRLSDSSVDEVESW